MGSNALRDVISYFAMEEVIRLAGHSLGKDAHAEGGRHVEYDRQGRKLPQTADVAPLMWRMPFVIASNL